MAEFWRNLPQDKPESTVTSRKIKLVKVLDKWEKPRITSGDLAKIEFARLHGARDGGVKGLGKILALIVGGGCER